MLDVTRLRVLAAVARQGSVTKAAQALHYAQPSVSHHLSRLEAETGLQLVQRVGRGVRLTPDGELLARRANEILSRLDAVEAEMRDVAGLHAGRVRVAAFQSALSVLVPPVATALREAHPNLELQLVEAHPAVAERQLREGQVDVAVVYRLDDTVPDDGLRYTPLLDDPIYLLALRQRQTLARHRDSAWIAGCEHCRADLLTACELAGFVPRIVYTSDDIVADQALVAAGLGVTTMPGLALRSHHHPDVQATRIGEQRRRVYAVTYGQPPYSPATEVFVRHLSDSCSALES